MVSKDDFDRSNWQECLASAKEKECFDYQQCFIQKAKEAEADSDSKRLEVFRLLLSVVSLHLRTENTTEPFAPGASGPDWRWPSISDYTQEQLGLFAAILPEIVDPELRARIADVLWVTRHGDYKTAHIAIESYLGSAKNLENHERWLHGFERIERAANLAASVRGAPLDAVLAHIDRVLKDSEAVETPSFFAAKLLRLLLELRQGEVAGRAALATLHAERAESAKEWPKAQVYWELAARWHGRSNDEAAAKTARAREAETYVREAEAAPSKGVAAHHLGRAIEAYRRVGGHRERVDELHREMLESQKAARADFKEISTSIDISDLVRLAQEAVRGKELGAALFALCQVSRPWSIEVLRKEVEKSSNQFLFMRLFPAAILSPEGKVVARHGPISHGPGLREEDQDAVVARMHSTASHHRHVAATGLIEPARQQIVDEHHVQPSHFMALVTNNPFVPPGREYLFAKGLHAGITGDFGVALHLLMPQFENSLRSLLDQRGVIVSTFVDGVQQEKDLNALLHEAESEKLFGADLLFELKGLLISRFGANLRNLMAHGLLSAADAYSTQSAYFWWLVLRLVCHPFMALREPAGRVDAEGVPENQPEGVSSGEGGK